MKLSDLTDDEVVERLLSAAGKTKVWGYMMSPFCPAEQAAHVLRTVRLGLMRGLIDDARMKTVVYPGSDVHQLHITYRMVGA